MRTERFRGHDGRELGVEVTTAGGGRARPVVVLLHGGAWRGGHRRDMLPLAAAAAERGFVAVSPSYSVDAEPALPAQLLDVQAAVAWVRGHAGELGADPRRVGALGLSAGGHLAALAGAVGSGPLTEGTRLGAVVTWSAPTDLTALAAPGSPLSFTWTLPLAGVVGCVVTACPASYAALSPVAQLSPDDPPMLVAHAVGDPLVPYAQAATLAERARAAGVQVELVTVPGNWHANNDFALLERSLDFLRARLDALAG